MSYIVITDVCRWLDNDSESVEEVEAKFDRNYAHIDMGELKVVEVTPEMESLYRMLHAHKRAHVEKERFSGLSGVSMETIFDYVVSFVEVHQEEIPELTDYEGLNKILEYVKQYE